MGKFALEYRYIGHSLSSFRHYGRQLLLENQYRLQGLTSGRGEITAEITYFWTYSLRPRQYQNR